MVAVEPLTGVDLACRSSRSPGFFLDSQLVNEQTPLTYPMA